MQIMSVKSVDKGAFKCVVDVKMPEWKNYIIRRIKVFEKNGDRWISFPAEQYEKDGQTKYFQYNDFEDIKERMAFQKELLEALDKQAKPQQSSPKIATFKPDNDGMPF